MSFVGSAVISCYHEINLLKITLNIKTDKKTGQRAN